MPTTTTDILNTLALAKQQFNQQIQDIFATDERIKTITFRGYAPYFNDGDRCSWGLHTIRVNGQLVMGDDYDNEDDYDFLDDEDEKPVKLFTDDQLWMDKDEYLESINYPQKPEQLDTERYWECSERADVVQWNTLTDAIYDEYYKQWQFDNPQLWYIAALQELESIDGDILASFFPEVPDGEITYTRAGSHELETVSHD